MAGNGGRENDNGAFGYAEKGNRDDGEHCAYDERVVANVSSQGRVRLQVLQGCKEKNSFSVRMRLEL